MATIMYGIRRRNRLATIATTSVVAPVRVIHGSSSREMLHESLQCREEARARRDGYAEEILELRGDDEQSGAGGEADHHGMRDEIDERTQPRDAHAELQQTHQQRERQHELDVRVGAGRGQRRHRREHDEGKRVGRAGNLMPRRTPQRRDDGGQHRAVEAVLWRHAGERGVRDALRQDDQRADESGQEVGAQRRARHTVAPREERKELQRPAAGSGPTGR